MVGMPGFDIPVVGGSQDRIGLVMMRNALTVYAEGLLSGGRRKSIEWVVPCQLGGDMN